VYRPADIEKKWQARWVAEKAFETPSLGERPKYYVLDMFPYPSGTGLHVGHVEGYTCTDIVARYKRMRGFDVLHPMGWDSFGLPAEQYAIETGVHPMNSTQHNILNFRAQCDAMGFSYDWSRVLDTSKPDYYRWTQWIFKRLFEKGLAYRAEALVNWCPALGTVLANDEVIDGKSERGGYPVERKPLMQWMLRITAYADRLLDDLNKVDYPESIAAMQRDRIGRSEGCDVRFAIEGHADSFWIYTTRPDTLFGASFCVVAPEHELLKQIASAEQRAAVDAYLKETQAKSDLERAGPDAGKTGVFTGAYAVNPVNGEKLPIWVADYVLATYGTGAIMAVPGHDKRDWAFAKRFDLPIREVIAGGDVSVAAWEGDGELVNSGFLNGLKTEAAFNAAVDHLEEQGLGSRKVRYRMRDWIFARQRYWGEPIPVVYDEAGVIHTLPDEALPVELPMLADFKPTGDGEAPLERDKAWLHTTLPGSSAPARRETHTMPTLAGSSWYFFRFIDPQNGSVFVDPTLAKRWMPVDLYVGGAEHAVGHLLYSRFFTKVLFDLGLVPTDEPYAKLVNPGMILGADSRKMSKRYGNAVNPTDVIAEHGADALRLFEMFLGPLEQHKPWNDNGVTGVRRFLDRAWRLYFDGETDALKVTEDKPTDDQLRLLHRCTLKVSDDIEALRLNTAVSHFMTFVNEAMKWETRPRAVLEQFALLLSPFAPHFAEEVWARLGHTDLAMKQPFPAIDPKWLEDDKVEIVIQVTGKIVSRQTLKKGASQAEAVALAKQDEAVAKRLDGREPKKVIFVQDRLLNFLV